MSSIAAAMELFLVGAWRDAEHAARGALAKAQGDPSLILVLGLSVAAMGEANRAAPSLNLVARLNPDAAHPCADLAGLLPPLPRPLIERQFRACLRLDPHEDRLRLAFAAFMLDNDQADEAERILAGIADSAAADHLRGLARAELNRFPAAIESFQRAVAADPDAAASWSNLGMVLKIEGQFTAAIEAHDRAVSLAPDNKRFRVNRAVALLKAGLWEAAWEDYEARLDLTGAPMIDRARLLQPDDALDGAVVVVLHEDGFGDTLQFLRYVPMLAERGARVIACVPPSLARILAAVPGVAAVHTDPRDMPVYHLVCPVFSLPRVFRTTLRSIPPVPALRLDPGLIQRWARRLPTGGLRVGLVWAGQARPALPGFRTLDRRRSAGLAVFEPLSDIPGVHLVSLQAGPPARQVRPPNMALLDPMPEVTDFADTAAIIASLDVVVSVDTSVVHLAGLMRKPVFLLDRYDGCWRWLTFRRDSPWYPELVIFRQPTSGDWESPVRDAAESLRAMAIYRGADLPTRMEIREPAFVA